MRQGTAVTKKYQMNEFDASTLAVPEQVSVAMGEIAADLREGLLALAVGAGLQVMQQLMEADVAAACGPRGKHDPDRTATRHGTEAGSVTLGGRRVPISRPRVRAADGAGEVPIPAYALFSSTEVLGRMAMERMLAGVSTRAYPVALEPVGAQVEYAGTSTSKSAVSRKFVALTETALADLLAAHLTALDLVAIMIDGVHFADHLCVVALGSGSTAPSIRSPWWRGQRRTPPWSGVCWSGSASAGWTSPGRSWPCWTAPKRCRRR